MVPLTYYDNSIVQDLIDNPNAWNNYHEWSKKEFGPIVEPIQSFYLFCEYFGFSKKKLVIPESLNKPDWSTIGLPLRENIKTDEDKKIRDEKITDLLKETIKLQREIEEHILQVLLANHAVFKQLITARKQRKEREHNIWKTLLGNENLTFENSNHLENLLFEKMIRLYESDFDEFVKYLASLLAWDELCSIVPTGISTDDVKELLVGFWRSQYQDHGEILPLARTAIGLTHYYKMDVLPKNYNIKNYKDMMDSEMYTKLILGQQTEDAIRPVHIITLETVEVARARMRVVAANVINIEDVLKIQLPKFPGKIHCVDKNLKLIESLQAEVPIRLPDLSLIIPSPE